MTVDALRYWFPIWHGPEDVTGNWSLTIGHFCLNWETRYYRTTGLQLWWDDHMWMLWRMTPSASANKKLDHFNARAMVAPRRRTLQKEED